MTITRTTQRGVQEVLTINGFRSREVVERDNIQVLYFDNEDGSKKVKELKADCRLPEMSRSITLNYS